MEKIFIIFLCVVLLFTGVSFAENEYGTGYIEYKGLYEMSAYTIEDTSVDNEVSFFSENELPEDYISPYVSSVKNQASGNTCWAFAVAGAMESWLLKNENKEGLYDFSENHMQYMISNRNNNPLGHNIGIGKDSGGNIAFATPYLMNRKGPVNDIDDVYNWKITTRDYSETVNIPLSDYVVTGIAILPEANIKEQKQMIVEYGATMCAIDSCGFFDNNKVHCYLGTECLNCLKHPESEEGKEYVHSTNHMVLVVGWDDNYSKEKFAHTTSAGQTVIPEGDGAFIVKNSWGATSGDGGYFYLSYYDCFSIQSVSAITGMKKRETGEIVYSHDDYFCNAAWIPGLTEVYYGNQFERKTKNEVLDEIVFFGNKNHIYDFYLVNDKLVEYEYDPLLVRFENVKNFEKIKINQEPYIAEYEGYHTVDVDDVDVTSEQFSVIVYEKTENGESVVVHLEASDNKFFSAVAYPLQSFFYIDFSGYFQDAEATWGYNTSVKAITKTTGKYSDISFINYTDENKNEKTTFTEGENIRIAAVVDGANLENSTLVCGIYKGDKLIKVLSKPIGNKGNIFLYENIPADFNEYTVRVFALDAFDNIKPLGNVLSKALD